MLPGPSGLKVRRRCCLLTAAAAAANLCDCFAGSRLLWAWAVGPYHLYPQLVIAAAGC